MKKKLTFFQKTVIFILLICGAGFIIAGTYPVFPHSTISTVGQCVAVTTSSAQYTLPSPAIYYYIKAKDASVFLLEGANPTATVTVGSGHGMVLQDGDIWGPIRLNGPKVAHIGDAAGEICFVPLLGT